ncbi:hypothetical protein, partial [Klebsiella pneumoniae]|uniref:hypothetical protein n=1 Tax=Klebsiella pneumoniae TaxID=573 RepID=UPI003B97D837
LIRIYGFYFVKVGCILDLYTSNGLFYGFKSYDFAVNGKTAYLTSIAKSGRMRDSLTRISKERSLENSM